MTRYRTRSELNLARQRREISYEQFDSLARLFDEQENADRNPDSAAPVAQGGSGDFADAVADAVLSEWKTEGQIGKAKVPTIRTRTEAIDQIKQLEANAGDVVDMIWADQLRTEFGIYGKLP